MGRRKGEGGGREMDRRRTRTEEGLEGSGRRSDQVASLRKKAGEYGVRCTERVRRRWTRRRGEEHEPRARG